MKISKSRNLLRIQVEKFISFKKADVFNRVGFLLSLVFKIA